MNELALFAGGGGGIYASHLLGHTTVCAVEILPYNRNILLQRQCDGVFPRFPIWDDVRTFDGNQWRGAVDIVSGGFPCQDISAAGRGAGIDGERSGLWGEMARIIREVQPRFVFVENSPMLTSRGLGRVLGDLASMGFNAEWGVLGASDVGALHKRERIWILAHAKGARRSTRRVAGWNATDSPLFNVRAVNGGSDYANTNSQRQLQPQGLEQDQRGWTGDSGSEICNSPSAGLSQRSTFQMGRPESVAQFERPNRWPSEPGMGRVVNGMAHRSHRIISLGNGQVPRVGATAWRLLSQRLND